MEKEIIATMNKEQEQIQHEAIKVMLKQVIQNNPNLTLQQKQTALDNLERAAKQADWVIEMMRICGFLN